MEKNMAVSKDQVYQLLADMTPLCPDMCELVASMAIVQKAWCPLTMKFIEYTKPREDVVELFAYDNAVIWHKDKKLDWVIITHGNEMMAIEKARAAFPGIYFCTPYDLDVMHEQDQDFERNHFKKCKYCKSVREGRQVIQPRYHDDDDDDYKEDYLC